MNTESDQRIAEFIQKFEEQLEEAGQISANRAFNLGCWIGLVPAGLLIVLIFFLSGNSWVVTLVSGVMILVSLIALANLGAYIAKSRSTNRRYKESVKSEIEAKIFDFSITEEEFDRLVVELLPQGSVLRKFRKFEEQDL